MYVSTKLKTAATIKINARKKFAPKTDRPIF